MQDLRLLHDAASVAAAAMLALRAVPPESFSADMAKELHVIAEHLMETRRMAYALATQCDDRLRRRPRAMASSIVTARRPRKIRRAGATR